MLLQDGFLTGAVIVRGDDFLGLIGVQVASRLRRQLACPCDLTLASTQATGGSAPMLERRINEFEFAAGLGDFQMCFVLPGEMHVADLLLGEGGGRAASPESSTGTWRYIWVTKARASASEPPRSRTAPQAAMKLSLPLPEILGLGVIICTPFWRRSGQSWMQRVAFADDENHGREIGQGAARVAGFPNYPR